MTLQLLFRVKNLKHVMSALLLIASTTTFFRILIKRRSVVFGIVLLLVACCLFVDWRDWAEEGRKRDMVWGVAAITGALKRQAHRTIVLWVLVSCVTLLLNGGGASGLTFMMFTCFAAWRLKMLPVWLQGRVDWWLKVTLVVIGCGCCCDCDDTIIKSHNTTVPSQVLGLKRWLK